LIGFGLYALSPQAPYIFTMLLAVALWAFALNSRAIKTAQPETADVEEIGEQSASSPYH